MLETAVPAALNLMGLPAEFSVLNLVSGMAASSGSTAASAAGVAGQALTPWASGGMAAAEAAGGVAGIVPGAAANGFVAPVAAGAAEAASPWAVGAATSSAGGASGAAGGGALAAAAPAAAVIGSGLLGLAAGTGMATVADDYGKGGLFGQNEWGQDRSAFDWASDKGHWVEDALGGGTLGTIGGAVTSGALSIPAGLLGFGQGVGNGIVQGAQGVRGAATEFFDWLAD